MKIQGWIDRGFWALICAIALYMSSQMARLSDSVNDLNVKMSVYITKSDSLSVEVGDHESRIRVLESSNRKR